MLAQEASLAEGRLEDMTATRIHLVRHGEVSNPEGVLYGRLPNFQLSPLGHEMAQLASDALWQSGAKVSRLIVSPLQRTLESAKPIAARFNVPIETEERIIEPWNAFEGYKVNLQTVLKNPKFLSKLYNPLQPSWGEPFREIASRMGSVIERAWYDTKEGDVVLVTHQLPIWMVHLSSFGKPLFHDPRSRRCSLSSITSFEITDQLREVSYQEPALELIGRAKDRGAV